MRHVFEKGGVTVGPTIAWATLEPDDWSPWERYERSEYERARPIIVDEDGEEDEEEGDEE